MEENIIISNLNDFLFCPRSIYFHNLYFSADESLYYSTFQTKGRFAHKNIDKKKYSSRKNILESIDIYSEELGIIGKIDLLDLDKSLLIERKYKIKKLFEGYYLQIYAQYFCLVEMGYKIKQIKFYSVSDNKDYFIDLPDEKDFNHLKEVIKQMKTFSLDKPFTQNPNKCKMCIYKELCDVYKNDE